MLKSLTLSIAIIALTAPSFAQGRGNQQNQTQTAGASAGSPTEEHAGPAEEKISTTPHTIRLDGREIKYTATAGTLPIRLDNGQLAACRRRGLESIVGHLHVPGREGSHVQPDRRSARTAVEQKRYRTRFDVFAVFRVGDEEHSRGQLTVVEPNGQRAGGRGVLDLASVEPDRVRRRRDLFFSGARVLLGRTAGARPRRLRLGLLIA